MLGAFVYYRYRESSKKVVHNIYDTVYSGEDIDYQKEKGNKINPLCVVIPEFLGYIKKEDR